MMENLWRILKRFNIAVISYDYKNLCTNLFMISSDIIIYKLSTDIIYKCFIYSSYYIHSSRNYFIYSYSKMGVVDKSCWKIAVV